MAKVIAVQENQLKMLRQNYDNMVAESTSVSNKLENHNNTENSLIPPIQQIDMESQVVNLNSQPIIPTITNDFATNEVFGPENLVSDDIKNSENKSELNINNNTSLISVPYQEPNDVKKSSESNINNDSYFELLNSLRNMITDFANNAYAAIDKFQEERLQCKETGANLINNIIDNVVDSSVKEIKETPLPKPNIFDDNSIDLDKTVVLPADFIANSISESGN